MVSDKDGFNCSIETENLTKTTLNDNNEVLWSEGDQLVIFRKSSAPAKYQISDAYVGKSVGGFYKIEVDEFNSGFELDHNVALYPYQDNIEIIRTDSDEPTSSYMMRGYNFPSKQTYVENSFAVASFPMAAVSEDKNLSFYNICGGIKLRLKGSQCVTSITIEGKNSEMISGNADIMVYSDGTKPELSISSDALTSVMLDCGDGVQLNEETATDFILALPPVKFTKGFTVSVTCADGSVFTMDTDKSNRIRRSSLLTMPVRTLGEPYDGDSESDLNAPTLPGHNSEPCFSETVELMGILWRLAGASEYCECGVPSVANSADEYFASMTNHRAVQLAREYWQQNICYDAVTGYANQLIFDDNGTLIFDPDYLEGSNPGFEARWNERQRNDMLIAVNEFYEESDFHTWFISTKAEQEQAIAAFKSVCNLDYSWFDTFYGKNDNISSRIILSFIIGPNNNGISLKRKDGSMFLTPVLGCLSQYNGNIRFGGDMNLIVHEFSHPYCNPLIEANWSSISESSEAVYQTVASIMESQAYGNARTMMCETLVRSCSIRYMISHNQNDFVDWQLEYEELNGFMMVRSLIKTLEKREEEASKYATLAEFMPEIINAINSFVQILGEIEEPDTLTKDYVDLGLVMEDGRTLYFATRNVGESSPGGIGSARYRWGATIRDGLSWTPPEAPYCGWPEGYRLDKEHDIAAIEWGGDWHTPSPEEWEALVAQCDYVRKDADESEYGVGGYYFYNKSDRSKFIFLPVAFWGKQEPEYWTSEIWGSMGNICAARKFNGYNGQIGCFGAAGIENTIFAVRPVIAAEGEFSPNGHDYVDLNINMNDGKKLYFSTMNVGETTPAGFGSKVYSWGVKEEGGIPWAPDAYYDDKRLDADHDIATLTWGEKWHIPSRKEWGLLIEKCDYEIKSANASGYGVAGYFFYNRSDHSKFIFLPISERYGFRYWTSDLYSGAYAFIFSRLSGRFCHVNNANINNTDIAIRPVFVE